VSQQTRVKESLRLHVGESGRRAVRVVLIKDGVLLRRGGGRSRGEPL